MIFNFFRVGCQDRFIALGISFVLLPKSHGWHRSLIVQNFFRKLRVKLMTTSASAWLQASLVIWLFSYLLALCRFCEAIRKEISVLEKARIDRPRVTSHSSREIIELYFRQPVSTDFVHSSAYISFKCWKLCENSPHFASIMGQILCSEQKVRSGLLYTKWSLVRGQAEGQGAKSRVWLEANNLIDAWPCFVLKAIT
jgi:hypothetical protein